MVDIRKVQVNSTHAGFVTLQLFGLNEKGQVCIGTSGGIPLADVAKEYSVLADLLDRKQASVTVAYGVEETYKKALTSGQIKA